MLPTYKRAALSLFDALGWLNWADTATVEAATGRARFSTQRLAEKLSDGTLPQVVVKRSFDLGVSVIFVAVLTPALLAIAALIKAGSPGPIFEYSWRIGKDARPFKRLRFRSMLNDRPAPTPLGRFLRMTGLDELPTLLNVIVGQMSLVGPFPLPSDLGRHPNVTKGEIAAWLRKRNSVRPGITGLWQSNDYLLDLRRQVLLDLYYVEQWSIWLDIYVVVRTIRMVIQHDSNPAAVDELSGEAAGGIDKGSLVIERVNGIVGEKEVEFAYEESIGWHVLETAEKT